jgi:excinuclease UvrABC nuclease subunit
VIARLKTEMMDLAEKLEFEKAAAIRDRILELEQLQLDL